MGSRLQPVEDRGFSSETRPFTALLAGVRFLMNLNDTRHFFTIFDAVDGGQTERNYRRYLESAVGSALDREGVNFAEILSNKEYLEAFAPGSLADCYLSFLSREDLDMELLMIAESDAAVSTLNVDRSRRNFIAGGFAIHDLLHVLTGYGRDPIGEACLLAFTAEQLDLRGVRIFAHSLSLKEQAKHPNKPVLAMIDEARKRARTATWAPEIDWRDVLGLPVDEARARLGFAEPCVYRETPIKARKMSIDVKIPRSRKAA